MYLKSIDGTAHRHDTLCTLRALLRLLPQGSSNGGRVSGHGGVDKYWKDFNVHIDLSQHGLVQMCV